MKKTKKQIEKEMRETYPFYDECIKNEGWSCPYCGSKKIYDWEKSRNYRGATCDNPDCKYIVSWEIIDIGRTGKIKIEELEFFEKKQI